MTYCREKEEEIIMSIRIGILGYGNLGRGVECAIKHNPDTELVAVFTRRDPETVKILTETAKVYSVKDAEKLKDEIDVLKLLLYWIDRPTTPILYLSGQTPH